MSGTVSNSGSSQTFSDKVCYTLILICDGMAVDAKNLIIN
jgi:hypothetical protein